MNYLEFKNYIEGINLDKLKYESLINLYGKMIIDNYFNSYIEELLKANDFDKMLNIKYYVYNVMSGNKAKKYKLNDDKISMKNYLDEVEKYNLLNLVQEKLLFYEFINYKHTISNKNITSNYLNSVLVSNGYSKNIEPTLVKRVQQLKYLKKIDNKNDIENFETYVNYLEIKNTLINSNLRLVLYVILNMFNYFDNKLNFKDLIQVGNIGLIKSVNAFDLSYNCKFSTYATIKIKKEIIYYIKSSIEQIHIPLYLQKELRSLENKISSIECVDKKIEERINELLSLKKEIVSLDDPIENDSTITYNDVITDDNNEIDDFINKDNNLLILNSIMQNLSKKEALVIFLRYGVLINKLFTEEEINSLNISSSGINKVLNNNNPLVLEEIGQLLGCSREWARVIHNNALKKIKNNKKLVKELKVYKSN